MARFASLLSYSHLLGLAGARAEDKADDEDYPEKRKDESDDDYAKRCEDWEKDHPDAASRRAKAEDTDDDDEGEEGEGEEAKKARKAKDEDDDKKARTGGFGRVIARAERRGVRAERDRCRVIFAAKFAAGRPDLAAHFAFNTRLSAIEAEASLKAMAEHERAKPKVQGLRDAMRAVETPRIGADASAIPAPNTTEGMAARIIAVGKRRRGEA